MSQHPKFFKMKLRDEYIGRRSGQLFKIIYISPTYVTVENQSNGKSTAMEYDVFDEMFDKLKKTPPTPLLDEDLFTL